MVAFLGCMGDSPTSSSTCRMEYSGIMDSADNAGMGIVQHYDVPSEHTRMLCLDGDMKVLNSYTVGCVDWNVTVL